jgi:hypothetical protein
VLKKIISNVWRECGMYKKSACINLRKVGRKNKLS